MDVSAEAADVVVRESLQATEAAAKLTLEGMKNVAVLLLAIAKQDMKVVGQTTAKRLARDPAPAVVIPIKAGDKAKFQKLAKEFGVLYFFAQKKGNDNGMLNVVSNENYAALLNAIMQQLGYPIPQKEQEEDTQKKAKSRAPQRKSSPERGSGLKPSQTTAAAVEPDSP
ncbi:MAG: PcfB family protein, partial [Lachnospiraceae bacterium]|nr:PcfB family protein [Lachnospiraceae bacterium]